MKPEHGQRQRVVRLAAGRRLLPRAIRKARCAPASQGHGHQVADILDYPSQRAARHHISSGTTPPWPLTLIIGDRPWNGEIL